MKGPGEILLQTALAAGIGGALSAATCGAVSWGSRYIRQIPAQSVIAGATTGGFLGVVAGMSAGIIDGTEIADKKTCLISSLVLGILAATTLSPIVSSRLGGKIRMLGTIPYQAVSVVALGVLLWSPN